MGTVAGQTGNRHATNSLRRDGLSRGDAKDGLASEPEGRLCNQRGPPGCRIGTLAGEGPGQNALTSAAALLLRCGSSGPQRPGRTTEIASGVTLTWPHPGELVRGLGRPNVRAHDDAAHVEEVLGLATMFRRATPKRPPPGIGDRRA